MTKNFKTNLNESLVTFLNHPLIPDSSVREIKATEQFILEWSLEINFNDAGIESMASSFTQVTGGYKITDEETEQEETFNFNSAGFTFTECPSEYFSSIISVKEIEIDFKDLTITIVGN